MGSLFKPDIPAPPPPPPPATIRDEINRVEQVPVKNPDGSTTYVTKEIPLSEAEQREKDDLNRIMREALDEIERLSEADYKPDEQTKGVLDSWQKERERLLEEELTNRAQQEEATLAQRGLSDSSAAQSVRRQRQLDAQRSRDTLQQERGALGEDIRNQRIGLQQNLYSLATQQKDADTVRRQQSAIQGQNTLISNSATRRASLNDYYRAQLSVAQSSPFSVFGKAVLGSAGAMVGGPVGATIGAGLGHWRSK